MLELNGLDKRLMVRIVAAISGVVLLLFVGGYAEFCDCDMSFSIEVTPVEQHAGGCHERKPVQRKWPCSENTCCGHCLMSETVVVNNALSKPLLNWTVLGEQPVDETSSLQDEHGPRGASPYEDGEADYFSSHIIVFTYFPQAPPSLVV
jgi:hypothetical protein